MAFSIGVTIEVRLTGSDTNGGGWLPGATGTDWSQQDTAQYSVTDGVTAGTTTITSATATFGTDVVGNVMYVQGGTGSVTGNWYQILTRSSATTITVDRVTGLTAGTGVTLKIGGAMASPGGASKMIVDSGSTSVAYIRVFVKYNASPYVITSATFSVAGGCFAMQTNQCLIGYDTVRSEYQFLTTTRPTLQLNAGVTGAFIVGNLNAVGYTESLILDGNNNTTSTGFQSSGQAFNLKAINCTLRALSQNSAGARAIYCEVANCNTGGVSPFSFSNSIFCVVHDCTMTANVGAIAAGSGLAYGCLVYNITTGDGFGQGGSAYVNCVAYNNGGHGFNSHNNQSDFTNCIAESNGGYGYRTNASGAAANMLNCASYGNGSGRSLNSSARVQDMNPISGVSSFFTNAAGGDFTLNSTTNAGALCRAAGFPLSSIPAWPGLTSSVDYGDVGALQHLDGTSTITPPGTPTLVDVPVIHWPEHFGSITSNPGAGSNAAITSIGVHYIAYVFEAKENMAITHVSFLVGGGATGSPTVDVRIETVDPATGLPNGLWATNTNVVSATCVANTRQMVALGATANISKAQVYCVKLLFNSGTNVQIGHANFVTMGGGISAFPYQISNTTGTPAKVNLNGFMPAIIFGSSATTFYSTPFSHPLLSGNLAVFNNSVAGAKRGMRIVMPFACRVVGLKWYCANNIGDFNMIGMNDAGVELNNSSTAVDQDMAVPTNSGWTSYFFDNSIVVAAGTAYRFVTEPTTATNTCVGYMSLTSSLHRQAAPGGQYVWYTEYTTAGGWTDYDTRIPDMELLIDQLPDGISLAGGGSGPIGDVKQFGRGAPY